MLEQLAEFDALTNKIQRDDATIRIARAYFDPELEEYSILPDRIGAEVHIVHDQRFELTNFKLQKDYERILNIMEEP